LNAMNLVEERNWRRNKHQQQWRYSLFKARQ